LSLYRYAGIRLADRIRRGAVQKHLLRKGSHRRYSDTGRWRVRFDVAQRGSRRPFDVSKYSVGRLVF